MGISRLAQPSNAARLSIDGGRPLLLALLPLALASPLTAHTHGRRPSPPAPPLLIILVPRA